MAFRYLAGDQHPDHSVIADFRKRHLDAPVGLFTQALLLCAEAGLVKLGHVAVDGTKIKANAGKHKAMSYQRMGETEARLKQEIDALRARAEQADAQEDEDNSQYNFTDPESRIMQDGANKGSFLQGYNAQIAVDAAAQVSATTPVVFAAQAEAAQPRRWKQRWTADAARLSASSAARLRLGPRTVRWPK